MSYDYTNQVVVITGIARGIGKCLAERFQQSGAKVYGIDRLPNPYFVGDVGREEDLRRFVTQLLTLHTHVDVLINNAMITHGGLDRCTYDEFNEVLRVGITAPFFLTQLLTPYFAQGASVINISSSRDRMSQPHTESYSAAKGGIAALTHALAMSLAGKVRVNSISPGWIDTTGVTFSNQDHLQHPVGRIGTPDDIANVALFLASPQASFITAENVVVDGGMTHQMIYHDDYGWSFTPK
jgi:NAD(P)-dependent dehydrogenase (short-subunit alcohol dehydrogenase family)